MLNFIKSKVILKPILRIGIIVFENFLTKYY